LIWLDMAWYVLKWLDMSWYVLVCLDMAWYVLICLDMAWYGLICLDMAWYGLIWLDMAWYGLMFRRNEHEWTFWLQHTATWQCHAISLFLAKWLLHVSSFSLAHDFIASFGFLRFLDFPLCYFTCHSWQNAAWLLNGQPHLGTCWTKQ
jgi:hypothetical protein